VKICLNIFFVLCLIVVDFKIAFAQNACFTIDYDTVCAPATVVLTECTNGGTNIRYDFGVGEGYVTQNSYTYTKPGVYTIKQLISSVGNNINIMQKSIYVVPKPDIDALFTPCEGYQLAISVNTNFYSEYILKISDTIFSLKPGELKNITLSASTERVVQVVAQNGPPSCYQIKTYTFDLVEKLDSAQFSQFNQTDSVNWQVAFKKNTYNKGSLVSENTGEQFFQYGTSNMQTVVSTKGKHETCVIAKTFDGCGNQKISDNYCTSTLHVKAENGFIKLSWLANRSSNFKKYVIYKDGSKIWESFNKNDTLFIDSLVECGKEYCYQLWIAVNTNFIKTLSKCIKAIKKQKPDDILWYITFENDKFILKLDFSDPIKKIHIMNLQKNYVNEVRFPSPGIELPNTIDCFRIVYEDRCENISDTSLENCKLILKDSMNFLIWNEVQKSEIYKLYKLNENSKELLFSGNQKFFPKSALDSSQYSSKYQVVAILNNKIVASNIVEIINTPFIRFPNAFSPNGDGVNDLFLPVYRFIKKYELVIYDSWGGIIFKSDDPNIGWDGMNGIPSVPYVYVCNYETLDGRKNSFYGNIFIIK
jgi:gliding motility-associated-like protein